MERAIAEGEVAKGHRFRLRIELVAGVRGDRTGLEAERFCLISPKSVGQKTTKFSKMADAVSK